MKNRFWAYHHEYEVEHFIGAFSTVSDAVTKARTFDSNLGPTSWVVYEVTEDGPKDVAYGGFDDHAVKLFRETFGEGLMEDRS